MDTLENLSKHYNECLEMLNTCEPTYIHDIRELLARMNDYVDRIEEIME